MTNERHDLIISKKQWHWHVIVRRARPHWDTQGYNFVVVGVSCKRIMKERLTKSDIVEENKRGNRKIVAKLGKVHKWWGRR